MFRFLSSVRCAVMAGLALATTGAGVTNAVAQSRQTPLFFDARRLPDMEVERRNQEVLQEQRRAAEERRVEAEANARRIAEEAKAQEARVVAEAAAKKKAEEARIAAIESEAKKKADEARVSAAEAQRKVEEEKRVAAEAAAKKKADELRVAEAEALRKAEDEKRLAAEAAAKKKADEAKVAEAEAQRKAEDDKRVAAAEAQRKADEEKKRQIAEAEAKKKADDAARVAAAEAQRKADDEKRRVVAEAEAKKVADEARATAAAQAAANAAQATAQATVAARATQQQTAALIPQVTPQATPAAPGAACEGTKAQISYTAGGVMRASIASPCRKGQALTVSYGGIETSRKIDGSGNAIVDVDLFLGNAQPITLSYPDGHSETIQPAARDLGEVSKVALIWQAPVNLDLHALENGVAPGSSGDVWSGAAVTAETAKAKLADGRGSGFVSLSDDGGHDGSKIEVYTFFHSPEQPNGVVSMVLDYASRGNSPSGEFCGTGERATIPYEVVMLSAKGVSSRERGVIAPAPCGSKFTAATRLIRDAVPDLQF